jgi:predicted nucleotidyltransferase
MSSEQKNTPEEDAHMKVVRRDSVRSMMKEGRYRAIRNLPVGWLLQILHSTDRSDRWFRLLIEAICIGGTGMLLSRYDVAHSYVIAFLIIHTLSWLLFGNFWVYMLDSFKWIKNPGIDSIIKYISLVRRIYESSGTCNAVLVYGSMCRGRFHNRSDLDLRIIRRVDSWKGFVALPISLVLRAYAFFVLLPVDFQVVDSMSFVKRQMRKDEHPIVVFRKEQFVVENAGISFDDVERDPTLVMKESTSFPT